MADASDSPLRVVAFPRYEPIGIKLSLNCSTAERLQSGLSKIETTVTLAQRILKRHGENDPEGAIEAVRRVMAALELLVGA